MGRHRSDPRGLARIVIATVAVALALGLLAVGAIALVNAVTGSDKSGPPGAQPQPGQSTTSASEPSSTTPLVIRAVRGSTLVTITDPSSNDVVFRGTLMSGEGRKYDQAPLSVVAGDGGAVQVTIYGRVENRPSGQRATWYVARR